MSNTRTLLNFHMQDGGTHSVELPSASNVELLGATSTGNMSHSYPESNRKSTKAGQHSCGRFGTKGIFWKMNIQLSKPPVGATGVVVVPSLVNYPCDTNGNIVPHTLYIQSIAVTPTTRAVVTLWLICHETPTHMITPASDVVEELLLDYDSPVSGLRGILEEGSVSQHIMYSLRQTWLEVTE